MPINFHFPLTVIDNFFDNPDEVIRKANKLTFLNEKRRWPGSRTGNLMEVCPALHSHLCNKVFSPWYKNLQQEGKFNCRVKSFFQRTEMYDPDPLSVINSGWPHVDDIAIGAGVIYLTPNANPDSGTSMFSSKRHISDFEEEYRECHAMKNLFYNDPSQVDREEYIEKKKNFCEKFNLTVEVKNVFNRCITYSGNQFHSESGFEGSNEEQRLTLVFFIEDLQVLETPLMRVTRDILI
jgi:hypothetical protein